MFFDEYGRIKGYEYPKPSIEGGVVLWEPPQPPRPPVTFTPEEIEKIHKAVEKMRRENPDASRLPVVRW